MFRSVLWAIIVMTALTTIAIAMCHRRKWKDQLLEGAASVFGPDAKTETVLPAVDVNRLHAKIGALTLENDFLEAALIKAGLLSAKR